MTESEETVLETESARKHSSCYSLPGPNSPANNTADKDERSFLALAAGHCTEHLPSIFISSLIWAPRRRNSQARPPPAPKKSADLSSPSDEHGVVVVGHPVLRNAVATVAVVGQDGLLPFAEAVQRLVGVMVDLQVRLGGRGGDRDEDENADAFVTTATENIRSK